MLLRRPFMVYYRYKITDLFASAQHHYAAGRHRIQGGLIMADNTLFDRVALYVDAHYVENAVDFVCDEVTEHTQDDLDDPFTVLSESVSCRFVAEGQEEDSEDYRTSEKMAVFASLLAQKPNIADFEDLLKKAGFHISRSRKEDLVISFCVESGIYDFASINELLREYSLPQL